MYEESRKQSATLFTSGKKTNKHLLANISRGANSFELRVSWKTGRYIDRENKLIIIILL